MSLGLCGFSAVTPNRQSTDTDGVCHTLTRSDAAFQACGASGSHLSGIGNSKTRNIHVAHMYMRINSVLWCCVIKVV